MVSLFSALLHYCFAATSHTQHTNQEIHCAPHDMEDDVRALDGAFTIYVMQRGPIQSFSSFKEFLESAEHVVNIPPHVLTQQYFVACADIWNESHNGPLQRDVCRQLISRLRELASIVLISPEDVDDVFHALSHSSDYIPSAVLLRLLEAMIDPNDAAALDELDAFAEAELGDDTVSCPMLLEFCDAYLWLSHSLAIHQRLVLSAASALDDGMLPDDGTYAADDLELIHVLQEAIESGRHEHLAARADARREAEAQLVHAAGKPTASSVFYPHAIVATNGTGQPIESLLAPIYIRAKTPTEALTRTTEMMAPQALVKRVADMRRASAAQEAKRQHATRAEILHSAYDATELAPLGAERKHNYLQPTSNVGVGERAAQRLFPHHDPPLQSMLSRLQKDLGVHANIDPRPHQQGLSSYPSTVQREMLVQSSTLTIQRKVTALRQRDYEERYLEGRRSRAVDKVKRAVQEAAGFFSASQPRLMVPNFDTRMPLFFDVHPKTTLKKPSKKAQQTPKPANVEDLRHELRIVLTDAVDALSRSAQGK